MTSLLESTPVNRLYVSLYIRRFVRRSYDWKGLKSPSYCGAPVQGAISSYELNQIVKLLPNF